MLPSYTMCLLCLHWWWKISGMWGLISSCDNKKCWCVTLFVDVCGSIGVTRGWVAKNNECACVRLEAIRVSKQLRKWPQRGSRCWIRGNGKELALIWVSSSSDCRKEKGKERRVRLKRLKDGEREMKGRWEKEEKKGRWESWKARKTIKTKKDTHGEDCVRWIM